MPPADLTAFGLGPAGPSTGNFGAASTQAAPPIVVVAGGLIPSPIEDPVSWVTIVLGAFKWPLVRGTGTAKVAAESKQKLDEQKAAGKAKAKLKQTGVDPCPIKVEIAFKAEAWASAQVFLTGIDPNSPANGGPFDVSHPDVNRRGVKSVMVENVGAVVWEPGGRLGKCSITLTEWTIDPPGGKGGGVKTPLTPQQAQAIGQAELLQSLIDITAAGINANSGQALSGAAGAAANKAGGGLDGPSGPNANAPTS